MYLRTTQTHTPIQALDINVLAGPKREKKDISKSDEKMTRNTSKKGIQRRGGKKHENMTKK